MDLNTDDFVLAADFFNRCRARGVQGSNTDFLICAVAARRQHSIFTTDQDFAAFAKVIPVRLHALQS
jgi:predicted nucleic acid-binding protein